MHEKVITVIFTFGRNLYRYVFYLLIVTNLISCGLLINLYTMYGEFANDESHLLNLKDCYIIADYESIPKYTALDPAVKELIEAIKTNKILGNPAHYWFSALHQFKHNLRSDISGTRVKKFTPGEDHYFLELGYADGEFYNLLVKVNSYHQLITYAEVNKFKP